MIAGAQCELNAGRPHASGTLSVAGAVRAVDLICDAYLGHHSVAANHRDAIELLDEIAGMSSLVEDFSLCHTHKTGFNYSASDLDLPEAQEVLDALGRLSSRAVSSAKEKGWFPLGMREEDFNLS